MLYDWTQLGVKEITNLYLYGQATTPTDLTDEFLIRPKDVSKTIRYGANIDVDMVSYMSTGPGRFALGPKSEMVQAFFSAVSDISWMVAGVQYKKADIISHLQLTANSDQISIKQVELADTSGDHWQRSYIWNSGLLKISDNATFSVDSQGKRSINNYSIRAFDDDFDFEGGGPIAYVANAMLEPQIDPWKIGRKVNIHFVDTGLPTRTYTASDYLTDGFNSISHVVSGGNSLKTLPAGALS
ncbi:MAG: hypothetical protein Q7T74_02380, partial [Candidatus Saccharibacteria bacterium]|nr:hypothetical protein [Candidatus Saccharibacteria bacterium]